VQSAKWPTAKPKTLPTICQCGSEEEEEEEEEEAKEKEKCGVIRRREKI